MNRKLTALAFAFLCSTAFAGLEEFFLNALYPEAKKEVDVNINVISQESHPLCFNGFTQFCEYEQKTKTEVRRNGTIFFPFAGKRVLSLNHGRYYDRDDWHLVENFDTSELEACGRNATNISQIYRCTIEFNEEIDEMGGNCRTSTSAFKLAYLVSELAREKEVSNSTWELSKVYVLDNERYNAHRFVTLRNEHGYYVLDPLWCMNENDIEGCIENATDRFYNEAGGVNYRGYVYKVDRIA